MAAAPRWSSRPAGRSPTIEPKAPTGSNRPGARVAASGSSRRPASSAIAATGTLTHKHRAPGEVLEQQPAADRAQRDGEAGHARTRCRSAAARSRAVGEGRGQQGQGRGVDQRGRARPSAARPAISCAGAGGERRDQRGDGERRRCRPGASGAGRTGRRGGRRAAAARRRPACTRPRPTAAGWSSAVSSRLIVGSATGTQVTGSSRCRRLRSPRTWLRSFASRFDSGSSSRNACGLRTSARPIATR